MATYGGAQLVHTITEERQADGIRAVQQGRSHKLTAAQLITPASSSPPAFRREPSRGKPERALPCWTTLLTSQGVSWGKKALIRENRSSATSIVPAASVEVKADGFRSRALAAAK